MFDGAELGKAIAAHPGDIEAALAAYKEALFPRSESEYADAYLILDLCLGDRAPFGLIDFLTGALEGSTKEPRSLDPHRCPYPCARAVRLTSGTDGGVTGYAAPGRVQQGHVIHDVGHDGRRTG